MKTPRRPLLPIVRESEAHKPTIIMQDMNGKRHELDTIDANVINKLIHKGWRVVKT